MQAIIILRQKLVNQCEVMLLEEEKGEETYTSTGNCVHIMITYFQ